MYIVYTYIYTYVCICVYVYIYIYIHTEETWYICPVPGPEMWMSVDWMISLVQLGGRSRGAAGRVVSVSHESTSTSLLGAEWL